jgi:transcriptional regulator with XRE-family HTH domain
MNNRGIFLPNSIIFDNVKSGRLITLAENEYGINKRIVQIRKTLGYSQEKFAEGIKVSRSFQGGIEANHRRANDRLVKMICLTYEVSENWLKTGVGEMFDASKDPKLERIIRNFNKMDPLLQDYVMKYLDWLVDYYAKKPK